MISMNCVEFYQKESAENQRCCKIGWRNFPEVLAVGWYEITEHDGEITYAEVTRCPLMGFIDVTRYDQAEYDAHREQEEADHLLRLNLEWEPDEEDDLDTSHIKFDPQGV